MSKPSEFAHANIDEIVDALNLPEAIDLVAGVGFWHTAAIPRLGVPAIKVRYTLPPRSLLMLSGIRWSKWSEGKPFPRRHTRQSHSGKYTRMECPVFKRLMHLVVCDRHGIDL